MTHPGALAERAGAAFNRREWPLARQLASQVLASGAHAGMHYVAGIACLELGQLGAAIDHLRKASAMAPERADVAAQLARALSIARMPREALAAADKALAQAPRDPMTLDTLGVVYTQSNAHQRAAGVFRRAARAMPDKAHYRFNLATALVYIGAIEEAEEELEACLALDPCAWKAHLTLAQLRRQQPERNHLARLRDLLPAAKRHPAGRLYVNLALAKECEDLGEYPAAFVHLQRGKAAGREARPYDIARDRALFDALRAAFPAPDTDACPGDPSEAPIFVVGMPRSGTTLVERILSAHPDVHSAGELQNFGVVLKRLSGSRTPWLVDPETVARAGGIDPRRLGAAYLESTRPGTDARPRFVDKLPHNFLYAGFIARALPNARIICLRRDPLDTCLSNFRQLFAQSSPYYDYSFDLLDTGRYYVLFEQLLAHWRAVLPGRVLEVRYEDLVDDQEGQTRRLLAHCGLSWDEACLRFEENAAPVATASAVQVRQPVYRSAMKRWRHYAAELAPLRELLCEAGIELPA